MSRLAYSLATAAQETSLSKATLERAIKSGALRAKKSSVTEDGEPAGSWVILHDSLTSWLEGLADG